MQVALPRRFVMLAGAAALAVPAVPAFAAEIRPEPGDWVANVSIARQKMVLSRNGEAVYDWPVSTAAGRKITPKGTFAPYWLSKNHRSSIYNNAPMPWAVFYDGNYAIHGTNQTKKLGSPASAGCVRLHPDNARFVFRIPETYGLKALKIVIA